MAKSIRLFQEHRGSAAQGSDCLEFRVWGLGFRVWGLGFRV